MRTVAVQRFAGGGDCASCRLVRLPTSASGTCAETAAASSSTSRHHSLNDRPRRAAACSHCAYSVSLSLVPSDRPRNCFGDPSLLVASMFRFAPFLPDRPRAEPPWFPTHWQAYLRMLSRFWHPAKCRTNSSRASRNPSGLSTTTAVGRVTTQDGGTVTLVSSSEPTLTPAQKAAMPNGAIPVSGARGVHAEQKIQQAAEAMKGRVTNVGTAPRNPCCPSQQNCRGMLDANGTSNSRPFQQ